MAIAAEELFGAGAAGGAGAGGSAGAGAAGAGAKAKRPRRRPTNAQRNARTSTREHGKRQEQRIEADRIIRQNRSQIREAENEQRRAANAKRQRNENIKGALATPFERHDTVSVSGPAINPIMLIVFTWAGIVLLYAMITTPSTTSGFFESMRTWVGLLYQTKPMFTTIKQEPSS